MLRSLFTGISGLNAHQQMLDITADNIANVNTTGFKSSSAVFQDTLSQTLTGGGAPAASGLLGGTNPIQIGLGVQLSATNRNFTQGSTQSTGVPSDLMINGDGFFMAQKNGQTVYTRAGAFTIDASGSLVTPDGAQVSDSSGAALSLPDLVASPSPYTSYSIDETGVIWGLSAANAPVSLGQIGIATFPNPNGVESVGDSNYIATAGSGPAVAGAAGTGSAGTITEGAIEMSNVDLAQELTNLIVAERGFQANSKVITTSDEILQTLVNLKS